MSRPTLYVAITNHGFGHVTRTAAVIADLQQQLPDLLPIFVTGAPRWLLNAYLPGEFIHRPRSLDLGVVQSDSLTMDLGATLEQWQQIQAQSLDLIAAEVSFIEQNEVPLILADIPCLATAIGQKAGIPCWMSSNFGWDFIYQAWGGPFQDLVSWIAEHFSHCDRLFRLPFHEPMAAFPVLEDVGLTGSRPRFSTPELKEKLNLDHPPEKTVLLTFGGLGLEQIPYANLDRFPDWQFMTFDPNAPAGLANLLKLCGRTYRPVDIMPICGRIVSKPGYGTFSEALRLGLPISSLVRDDFAEGRLLLEGLRTYGYHQILTPAEFYQGSWDFLRADPQPPQTNLPLPNNGNQAIVQAIQDFLGKAS
ncbi:glycosyl transferase [Thermosynechococcaceae cyanobacterium BACA0444]|uniref:Glycosyl transferase n=1 Tax=Pseudocalidococcus azoricus BACA0444 TaxID=2918990 RepID=A0AAE4FPD8_9CYAN|nr:glycosyl transferase [Pseudocalidococcus azoricus]MDS3859666.1 glycosyl transferase [Pseudocalidococcus azoricus BACA0444]